MTTGALQPQLETVSSPGKEFSWPKVFLRAIIRPVKETYQEFLKDPHVSKKRAYAWVFYSMMITKVLVWIFTYVRFPWIVSDFNGQLVTGLLGLPIGIDSLLDAPVSGLLAVLTIIIEAAIFNWLARRLGGKGHYSELLYTIAAIQSPIIIITNLISLVDLVVLAYIGTLISFPFQIYQIVLDIIAIKAVYEFSWRKAILTGVLPSLVYLLISSVIRLVILYSFR
ncbi:MAG: YIP1 family protein [Anaerolineaceae bacterium]|jgi:hypothetical protein